MNTLTLSDIHTKLSVAKKSTCTYYSDKKWQSLEKGWKGDGGALRFCVIAL